MRATALSIFAACALLAPSHGAVAAQNNADETTLQNETSANRSPDRWQGRQHYLFDDDYQPNSATVGSGGLNAEQCAEEFVRMRQSDGTTVVRRINRCK